MNTTYICKLQGNQDVIDDLIDELECNIAEKSPAVTLDSSYQLMQSDNQTLLALSRMFDKDIIKMSIMRGVDNGDYKDIFTDYQKIKIANIIEDVWLKDENNKSFYYLVDGLIDLIYSGTYTLDELKEITRLDLLDQIYRNREKAGCY